MTKFMTVLLAVLSINSSAFAQGRAAPRAGAQFIDLTLRNEKGEDVKLSSVIKGKVAVIDFWATRCGICLHEAPAEVKLVKEFQADSNLKDKVVFVMLSVDRAADRANWIAGISKYFENVGVHLNSDKYWDSEAAVKYGIDHLPTIMIVNAQGKIVNADAPHPSSGELATAIKNAL